MQIVLARHGKPNLRHWVWITPKQIKEWINIYDSADIVVDGVPAATEKIVNASAVVVSSTMRRSIQSARRLCVNRQVATDAVFSEAGLPYFTWPFPHLPLSIWAILLRLAWFRGFSSNTETLAQATARAAEATRRLVQLAQENGSVVLVGHGIMTMLIAKQLMASGWSGPKRPFNSYWQFSVYRAPHLS